MIFRRAMAAAVGLAISMQLSAVLAGECVRGERIIVTSEVAFQVFDLSDRFPGVEVTLQVKGRDVRSGKTDSQGYIAFSGLPAGTYRAIITGDGFASEVVEQVKVLHRGDAPARLIAVRLGLGECPDSVVCVAPGGAGPASSTPDCISKAARR
jgi:hypothetical protein